MAAPSAITNPSRPTSKGLEAVSLSIFDKALNLYEFNELGKSGYS
jgi:hypothetical protein